MSMLQFLVSFVVSISSRYVFLFSVYSSFYLYCYSEKKDKLAVQVYKYLRLCSPQVPLVPVK